MILPAQAIADAGILDPLEPRTRKDGTTYGLGPAGYDLRLVLPRDKREWCLMPGEFLLAATVEHFNMPLDVLGKVCDKSTFARRGVSVFNTVIEPGWRGWLTLEIKNLGQQEVLLRSGQGIAQVVFQRLETSTSVPYEGKYQDQMWGPQEAIIERG